MIPFPYCLGRRQANNLGVIFRQELGNVPVLVGVELIFSIAAGMGLCFGFLLETMLITQG